MFLTFLARGGIRALLLLGCLSALAADSVDERLRVQGEGVAQGTGGAARTQAVSLAEHTILSDVVSQLLPSRELPCASQFQTNITRYVQDTKVVSTDYVDDSTRVSVEAFVDDRALKDDIAKCVMPLLPEPPTVFLFCAEQTADGKALMGDKAESQKVVAELLGKAQIEILPANNLASAYTDEQLLGYVRAELKEAGDFARESRADAVILVNSETVFMPSSQVPGWLAVNIKTTLRVFNPMDGRLLEANTREATVHCQNPLAGLRQSLQDAATKAAAGADTACILAAASARQLPGAILVLLENPGSREATEAAGQVLASVAGEGHVELIYASERIARFRLSYAGALRPLSEAFARADCAGKRVELMRAVDDRVVGRFFTPEPVK